MTERKVKVLLNKDQRWSFGDFKEGAVVEVTESIATTMVECGYGDIVANNSDDKALNLGLENKVAPAASEDKSEEAPADETASTETESESDAGTDTDSSEEAPAKKGKKSKKGDE